MQSLIRRFPRARIAVLALAAVAIACLAASPLTHTARGQAAANSNRQNREGARQNTNAPKRLPVYVAMQGPSVAVIAFRSPEQEKRIVFGFAVPDEQSSANPGHLYQIPGFKESLPLQSDIDSFRAALKGQPSEKFDVKPVPVSRAPASFQEVSADFREYVHKPDRAARDLEVWDVTSDSPVRLVIIDDLVLVQPPSDATSSLNLVEAALVGVLSRMWDDENRGKPQQTLPLVGPCAGARRDISAVQQNPLDMGQRLRLREAPRGAMVGPDSGIKNDFVVSNGGWKLRELKVEARPERLLDDALVRSSTPPLTFDAAARKVVLSPCSEDHITIEPRDWYMEFDGDADFKFQEGVLTVGIPAVGFRWNLVAIPSAILGVVGVILLLVRRARRNRGRRSPHDRTVFQEPTTYQAEQGESKPWWKFWLWWRKTPADGNLPKSLEGLMDAVEQRSAEAVRAGEAEREAVLALKQKLAEFQQLGNVREEHRLLKEEHQRWMDELKELGDNPTEIVTSWRETHAQSKELNLEVVKLGRVLADDGENHGGEAQAQAQAPTLADSFNAARKLTKARKDYLSALPRILSAFDPGEARNGDEVSPPQGDEVSPPQGDEVSPQQLADKVGNLRRLLNMVLKKFAEPLQADADGTDFSRVTFGDAVASFDSLVKRQEVLGRLEADGSVRRARVATAGIRNIALALKELHGQNRLYFNLLEGTKMELAPLADKLFEAAEFAESTLNGTLARQVGSNSNTSWGAGEVLLPFFKELLSSNNWIPLTTMLRLRQVMEAYCRESDDPLAARFYADGDVFRIGCEQLLTDFESLGIRVQPIHFLEDPAEHGLIFSEAPSVPYVQNSPMLVDVILKRFGADFDEYRKTVCDVSAWGFECDPAPDLNTQTNLWLWREPLKGPSES